MSLPQPLEAVLFDLDGTLVESAGDLADALDRLLVEMGLPPVGLEATKRMVGDGARKTLERAFARVGAAPSRDVFDAAFARFMDIYENDLGDTTTLMPGARECLERLRDRALPLGLVTNKPAGPTRLLLQRLDLTPYFATVVGGGDVAELKPHPLPLLTAAAALGARPETSVYVGDSRTDLDTARAAGIAIALIPSGYGMHPVAATESDLSVPSLTALAELLTG